jgi:hypothetical protein
MAYAAVTGAVFNQYVPPVARDDTPALCHAVSRARRCEAGGCEW